MLVFNTKGQSLIQVIVGLAVGAIAMMAFLSMTTNNQKETRAITEKMASMDLQTIVSTVLADGQVCTYILTDVTQATNRSTNIINSDNLSSAVVNINSLPSNAVLGAPVVAAVGQLASPLSSSLRISSISLKNWSGGGDVFLANLEIAFNSNGLVRPLKPIVMRMLVKTDPTTPSNAKLIKGCVERGSLNSVTYERRCQWSSTGSGFSSSPCNPSTCAVGEIDHGSTCVTNTIAAGGSSGYYGGHCARICEYRSTVPGVVVVKTCPFSTSGSGMSNNVCNPPACPSGAAPLGGVGCSVAQLISGGSSGYYVGDCRRSCFVAQ